MPKTDITPELLRKALSFIPVDVPRDEWVRIGMAIKSEYPDETGWQLFSDWSASGAAYDAAAVRSTWRSIKAGGPVGVSTLLYQAKQHGFRLPKQGQAAQSVSPEELARRERERKERAAKEAQRLAQEQAQAAEDAAQLWAKASESGSSAYLVRKGVQGFGVRYDQAGWLLVPVRDAECRLWNVQRIAPEPVEGGPSKLFVKGGRKSGLWHMIGSLGQAHTLLIAEGYATAASLHQATGLPVTVAFDAGNLANVAQALRAAFPTVALVVCGDDDKETEARTGKNPGRLKATEAAKRVHGAVAFPRCLPEGASDFNDMHKACGLDAVAACVHEVVQQHWHGRGGVPATAEATESGPQNGAQEGEQEESKGKAKAKAKKRATAPKDQGDSERPDPFLLNDDGVWFQGWDRDGKPAPALWVCSPLEVEAVTRDQEGAGWGYLLRFPDPLGNPKQWAMPARMLSGDGGEYRAALLNLGLRIGPGAASRNKLTEYIQTRQPGEFATCTDRIGWHDGRAFVLPHETLGDGGERIVFQSESQLENTFRTKRDAAAWRDRIGALCVGNSRLVFAASCAFAGPLLRPAAMESGGFHIRGDSSSGKTTALRVAASVYGGPSYMQRWRTTDNALEAIAAQHCDALLILDELAQVEGKVAGECAYMLANEQSKARANRSGGARSRLSWRLLFLSAGELGLGDHMAEGGKRVRSGQEVRMADIPADAGAGMGLFEHLHGMASGAEFSSHLAKEAQACHGATGRAFLQWLVAQAETLAKTVRSRAAELAFLFCPDGAGGQVSRVAARFALVGVAGALATEAGLTGWAEGESENAAKECFDAWIAARGGAGNGEVSAMLRQARRFLEAHGEGRFTWWHRAADDHNAKTLQRAGFRRLVGADGKPIKSDSDHQREFGERMTPLDGECTRVEFFVLPEAFRTEICQGFDHTAMCRVLLAHGCLVPDKGRTYDAKPRLPGIGPARCYRISPSIFELDV